MNPRPILPKLSLPLRRPLNVSGPLGSVLNLEAPEHMNERPKRLLPVPEISQGAAHRVHRHARVVPFGWHVLSHWRCHEAREEHYAIDTLTGLLLLIQLV